MPQPNSTGSPSPAGQTFRVIGAVAMVMGLISTVQASLYGPMVGQPMGLVANLAIGFSGAFFWVLVTPLVLHLGQRFRLGRPWSASAIAAHVVSATVLLIPYAILVTVPIWGFVTQPAERGPFGEMFLTVLLSSRMALGMALYFGVLGVHGAIETVRRLEARQAEAVRLEAALAKAQLQALQMQIHPHFLFNTLQAIRTLVDEDPAAARRTVTLLGDLLRMTLAQADAQVVPLRRELEFLGIYLEIERTRFPDRLQVDLDVGDDVLETPVPSFVLQPLVENAIKHGIAPRREPGRVSIRARREGDHLAVTVRNDGPPLSSIVREGGIGLGTTRSRLDRLYGSSASLVLENDPGGGVRAELRFPLTPGQPGSATGTRR